MPKLALFPLQLVVFPGELLNLHIFEPRYRKLVADCESEGIPFGVPTVIGTKLQRIATEVSLTEVVQRYPSGESDITCVGGRIFAIDEFSRRMDDKPYPAGDVTYLPIDREENAAVSREIVELTRTIYRQLGIEREVRTVEEGFTTYDIAHYVGFTIEQEYEFLGILSAEERQLFLLDHLGKVRSRTGDPLGIRARAELNGHFKNLSPPDF